MPPKFVFSMNDVTKIYDEKPVLRQIGLSFFYGAKIDACDGWEIERLMDIASDALVLPPDDMPVKILSGGERRRVALCKVLLERPDLLLLDEPTNDLDVDTMRVLEEGLLDFPGCAMVISHDRFFLDKVCTHLLILEGGGQTRWFEGNFEEYEQKVLRAEGGDRLAHRRGKYKRLSLK